MANENFIAPLLRWLLRLVGQPAPDPSSGDAPRPPRKRELVVDAAMLAKTSPERKLRIDIVGENGFNDDETDRQFLIEGLRRGALVELRREPENPGDARAIAVHSARGQIGYLSRANARVLAPMLDAGIKIGAEIAEVRGGTAAKPSRGVWINIWKVRGGGA